MAYRRKGSGKPGQCETSLSSEEPSHTDEPPSMRGADSTPFTMPGTEVARDSGCGPKDGQEPPSKRCSVCGRRTFLFALPGQTEKYCFECSADVATTHLLTTEIDAATMAGQDANSLITEFEFLSSRLLARAQSA